MTVSRDFNTPHGPGRLYADNAQQPWSTIVLSHGAGAGVDTADLTALASRLPAQGISVIRVEQPWRVAGKRVASPPAWLDAGLAAAVSQLRLRTPLILGGRSAGARSACRMATSLGALGVVGLAFPLEPGGDGGKSRVSELNAAAVPTLIIQGTRDAFGGPEKFAGVPLCRTRGVVGADHSFKFLARLSASQTVRQQWDEVAADVVEFVSEVLDGNRQPRRGVE